MPLAIAKNLTLPDDAVTQTFAILAKRGVGKTYTASVMAEEMAYRGLPFVAIDPIGVWWGLRAQGRADGLPIPVLGGDHGDVPITPEMGAQVAELIASERLTCVIDLGPWRKGQAIKFMTAFAETLYRKNRRPLHLFLDEADAYAPQRTQRGEGAERLLGAIEDIVRRGRARGLGCTLISQRPAVLNKNVLTQVETLVVHRITSPQDRKAIDDWVKLNAEVEEAVESTLPGLAVGEAWWWSPAYLGILEKAVTRERNTFDSSDTPDDVAIEPKDLAAIDLSGLHAQFEEAIEEQKRNDPAELRRQNRELMSEKGKLETRISTLEAELEELQVPALAPELVEAITNLSEETVHVASALTEVAREMEERGDALDRIAQAARDTVNGSGPAPKKARAKVAPPPSAAEPPKTAPAPATPRERPQPTEGLTAPQQRILDALAALEGMRVAQPSKSQVALFAEQSPKSSGFQNNLGTLRNQLGLIEYPKPGYAALTDEGRAIANAADAPQTLDDMHRYVERLVPRPQWNILHVLIRAFPHAMSRETLAEAVEQSVKSSGFQNNLGALRGLGLLDYPGRGEVAATPTLMLEGTR
jgi:hypothetical protein